ncbi:MAG TPA: hypothetical protein VFU31_19235 [Candidatus Binatia bacterium]|nr:hypothetical protein [Candidatus Binatia bacterium]
MATKYYRKLSPDTKPVLANGATVTFKTVDSVVGYFATDNEYVQAEFVRFAGLQRYGISEITAEEFKNDFLAKKNSLVPSRQPWREEIGPGASALQQISEIKGSLASAAVAVSGTDVPRREVPIVAATPTREQVQSAPGVVQEFKPVTKKRGVATK